MHIKEVVTGLQWWPEAGWRSRVIVVGIFFGLLTSLPASTQQVMLACRVRGLYSRQLIMFVVLEGFFADSAVVDFSPPERLMSILLLQDMTR